MELVGGAHPTFFGAQSASYKFSKERDEWQNPVVPRAVSEPGMTKNPSHCWAGCGAGMPTGARAGSPT
jgi:hypothetical protein